MLKNITALAVAALLLCAPLVASAQVTSPAGPVTLPASTTSYVLTSASPTACTTLATVPTSRKLVLVSIANTGPASSVFLQLFDDTKCSVAANVRWGDGSTVVIPAAATPIVLNVALTAGLSYTLSGALTSNVVITTAGIGF